MSKLYAIADLHLNHFNMAVKRGFSCVEDHNELIINNWNNVISKRDVVWVMGDITREECTSYHLIDRLNGIIKVVLGNHDKPQHIPQLLEHVRSVCGAYQYKGSIFTHIPIHECEIDRFRKNIHGHVHEKTLNDTRYVNVSCEAVDYTPQLISSLL